MTSLSTDIENIIADAQQKKEEEARTYGVLALYIAETLPPFKAGMSNKEKRSFIRDYVGKQADQFPPLRCYIDQHKLYSITCTVLAKEYGLNDSDITMH